MCALVTGVQTCALPISRRDTERVQRRRAVGDADVRKVDRTFADDARRARRDRLVDEFVPVGRLALHRDEEIALRHLARAIGRASCRDRGGPYVKLCEVAGTLQKKTTMTICTTNS